jgi:hypothetical protein
MCYVSECSSNVFIECCHPFVRHLDSQPSTHLPLLAGDAPIITLCPKICLTASDLGNQIPTAARWSPHFPHEHLIVGCIGGIVAVMRLDGAATSEDCPGVTPLSLVKASGSGIRCLAWAPPEAFAASPPEDSRNLFVAGGGQGFLAVFDMRDPLVPALDLTTGPRSTSLLSHCILNLGQRWFTLSVHTCSGQT